MQNFLNVFQSVVILGVLLVFQFLVTNDDAVAVCHEFEKNQGVSFLTKRLLFSYMHFSNRYLLTSAE